MRIRTKLAWAFILLIVAGIMTIAAYTIFVVRQHHTDHGFAKLADDARRLGLLVQRLPPGTAVDQSLRDYHAGTGHAITAFDSTGRLLFGVPEWQEMTFPAWALDSLPRANAPVQVAEDGSEWFYAFVPLAAGTSGGVRYLRVGQPRAETFRVVQDIRWIIYTGMFISIGLVVVASFWIARWISRPVAQLRDQAARIATGGDVGQPLALDRRDEFGDLATSLNQMAERFRRDNAALAEMAERQKQFYADIAHELRNPLHTLMASLELLDIPTLPEAQRTQSLEVIRRQANRLHRLFEDLMTLERSDRDPSFVKLRPTPLAPLLQNVASAHRPQASEKGLEITVQCPENITAHADAERLEQVLDNLVSNAVKFTTHGHIALSAQVGQGGKIEVTVTDTGPGIAPKHLPRLFDRFYRTDAARSRDKGGTGLGLAVVHRIVEAHGSRITVTSTVGHGAVFGFELEGV